MTECTYTHPVTKTPCQFHGHKIYGVGPSNRRYCIFHLPDDDNSHVGPKRTWTEDLTSKFQDSLNRELNLGDDGNPVDLSGSVFPPSVIFASHRSKFPDVVFAHTQFLGKVDFDNTVFSGRLDFRQALFVDFASFRNAQFQVAYFQDAKFQQGARFSGSRFGTAQFMNAQFGAESDFSDLTVESAIGFRSASIASGIFDRSSLGGNLIDFSHTRFSGLHCRFRQVTFGGEATFRNAMIGSLVNEFANSRFIKNAVFAGKELIEPCDFSETTFEGDAIFSDRDLPDGMIFEGARFLGRPVFYNAKIHAGIDFSGASFEFRNASGVQAFRYMRKEMEDRRDRPQEARFYRLEKRCERLRHHLLSFDRFASWAYDAFSGYGQSMAAPLGWLAASVLFFAGLYCAYFGFVDIDSLTALFDDEGNWKASLSFLGFSLEQVARPFAIWSGRYETAQKELATLVASGGLGLRIISSVQTLTSLSLIAMFVVALRWQFRRA
jgi:uncharacterized protein YjbI with pentapeptide repeats